MTKKKKNGAKKSVSFGPIQTRNIEKIGTARNYPTLSKPRLKRYQMYSEPELTSRFVNASVRWAVRHKKEKGPRNVPVNAGETQQAALKALLAAQQLREQINSNNLLNFLRQRRTCLEPLCRGPPPPPRRNNNNINNLYA